MDNFDLKKYLAEGRLLRENIQNYEKDLQKIRKLAKKYGYVEVKDPESYGKSYLGDEMGVSYTAIFIDPKDKDKNTFVSVWTDKDEESPEFGYLQVHWGYWGGPSGNDSIDYWTLDSTWKKMINDESI